MANEKQARQKLSSQELSNFCEQVAMMLDAGMVIYDVMEAVAQTHENSPRAEVYAALSRGVAETGTLCEALRQSGSFPIYMVEMAGIGERAGRLEEVMHALSEYYAREGRIRRAITSAITYPVVLGAMMALIVLVMNWKVLPLFQRVLSNMGIAMTSSGSALLSVGIHIAWGVLAIVGLLIAVTVVCVCLLKTGKHDQVMALLRKAFPPLGRLSGMVTSSRVASVLSMMLSSGFPLDEAMNMVPNVLEDPLAREKVAQVRQETEAGKSFIDALLSTGLFDKLYDSMIRTGYGVGCVDHVMQRVAHDYEEKAEDAIADLVSIIEPSLVGVLSIVIGAVLLSVMLPMVGVISSML